MSEYIYGTDDHEGHWLTGEKIVRCRDCKRFDKETEKWCRFEHETAGVQWRTAEPDGFCKWGVRE